VASAREIVLRLLLTARDAASGALERVRAGAAGIRSEVETTLAPLRSYVALLAGLAGIGAGKELIERADAFTRLSNQLRVATKNEEEFQAALKDVTEIANRTNSTLETTATLYSRVSISAKTLGLNQQQAAELTELISKGMQLSGATAQEYSSAVLQLTQAFNSGVLRGEEFNAVMEASPELMRRIAAGLGVAVGELRGLAEQGKLTAGTVSQALLSQKAVIDEVYAKLPITVDQALNKLNNAGVLFVGQLNQQYGATQKLVGGLRFLGENLDALAALMGAAVAAGGAKLAQSFAGLVTASLAARNAAREQAVAAAQQQAAAVASAEANVAAAQAAYNRALAEQRLAATIVALLQAELGYGVTEAEIAAARTRSAAAATAATAATERYAAAQAALSSAEAAGAAASVGRFATVLRFLTGPAGLLLTAVAGFAALYAALRKPKTATDELTQSTEQYAASLDRLNQKQLDAALLRINDTILAQQQVVSEAADSVKQYRDGHIGLIEALTESQSRAQLLTAAEGALADQEQTLADLQAKREAVLARLATQQQSTADASAKSLTTYRQVTVAMENQAAILDDLEKQLKTVASAQSAETQALADKAELLGNQAEADRKRVQLAEQAAKVAQENAVLIGYEAIAAQEKLDKLQLLAKAQETLTVAEQKALTDAERLVAAKQAEARSAQALADKLAAQARSEEAGIAAKDRALQRAQQTASATRSYVSALEELANAQIEGIRQEIELAKAKGETGTAIFKSTELAKLENQWTRTVAEAKKLDIQAEILLEQAKIARIGAQEKQTEADQKEIAASQIRIQGLQKEAEALTTLGKLKEEQFKKISPFTPEYTSDINRNTEAVEKNAKAVDEQSKSYTLMEDAATGALRELSQVSAGMNELLSSMLGLQNVGNLFGDQWSGELGKLKLQLDQTTAAIKHNLQIIGPYAGQFEKNANAANAARLAYLNQAIAATSLAEELKALNDSATVNGATLENLASQSQQAHDGFNLLDAARLENLQREIDKANARLREMRQVAQDARDQLAELNAEIAAEKGDTATADRLKLQLDQTRALADAEAKLQEARASGNAELIGLYEEQKRKLEELYRLKQRNLEADLKERDSQQQTTKNSGTSRTNTPAPTAPAGGKSSGGGGITINLNANNARLLDKGFVEDLSRQLKPELERIGRLSA
jgi:tape measure domain-containing protein